MPRETKAQMEARIREEVLAEAKAEEPTPTKKSRVKIPAFAATSPSEVIGLGAYAGNGTFRVIVAARDGEAAAPRHSEKSGYGVAKAKPLTPETVAYILDHEDEMRKLIATCEKLNA